MVDLFNPWSYFRSFYSTTYTQNFLNEKYKHIQDGEKLSYQNSYSLIYYIDHAKKYYDQSMIAPYELQPVLLFYGMIQLMKGAILTVDPNYPETTQVLAHGVSTRKRKKLQYEFLFDEVKVQKNGLITHFSEKMFQMKQLEGEKYKMRDLMERIPELHSYFFQLENRNKICIPMIKVRENQYSFSNEVLDQVNVTVDGFHHLLSNHIPLNISKIYEETNKIFLIVEKKISPLKSSPLQYNLQKDQFQLPAKRELYTFLPELIAHYLILYNLSMVCRYETDWWGELYHHYPSNDLPFITEFLEISKQKVPYYIALLFQG